jgi:multimeric flavodoxin WrbA
VGADTQFIHLYDLNFKGCSSCFACKRIDKNQLGVCVMKDELTNVLDGISNCDVLLLGSPIYFGSLTGAMHSLLERLLFPKISYNPGHGSIFKGKISSGFIYTMNVPEDISALHIPDELKKFYNYDAVFQYFKTRLQVLNGTSEFLLSQDTYQFDDYSKYDASMFNELHKAKVKEEQFPLHCRKAFDMGARLAAN